MIPSYKKDLRIRAWKNALFWVVVLVFAAYLQLFFQGYYVNYSGLIHRDVDTKKTFLKPFGIIDMHVLPTPDAIYVGGRGYVNNSKEIYDLGDYTVSVYKSGYLAPEFPISITAKNPFYTNALTLMRFPQYRSTGFDFDRMELVDGVIYATSKNGFFFVFNRDLQVLRATVFGEYRYIGRGYFTSGSLLYAYDYVSGQFKVEAAALGPKLALCPDWQMYGDVPYCASSGHIFDRQHRLEESERILRVAPGVILTDRYVHNTESYGDWRSYEYANPLVNTPDLLVHLSGIPFVVQSGSLVPLEVTVASRDIIASGAVRLDSIIAAKRFWDESVFVWYAQGKTRFSISHGDQKWWYGSLDAVPAQDIKIERVGSTYVFTGPFGAYVYYRGANKVFHIVSDPILALIDGKLYFQKDKKTQVIDLQRK